MAARAVSLWLTVLALVAPRALLAVPPGAPRAAPPAMASVSLTHDGNGTASVNTNASSATTFTLTSLSVNDLTVNLVVSVCNGALAAGSCTRSPTSVFLPSTASTTITVNFSGGTLDGTGTITLRANNTSGTQLASSSVTVTVAKPLPTVSAAPHVGDRRDVSMCIAACFESTLSYTTPAYVSLDVPRSATLLYRSGRANPYGTLALDVTDPYATATKFRLKLKDANGAYLTFSNDSTALYFTRNPAGPTRMVAQFAATSIPTSAALYTAEVTMFWPSGEQGMAPATVRILVLNATNSPYGAGVELVDVQRIWFNQPGGVLVTDGTGSATFFAGTCDVNTTCSYTSPSGEFSTLTTSAGLFYRTYPDGTQLTFYPDGHHYTTVDRFGSATVVSYAYNWPYTDYVPAAITDPVGQSITFGYRDANWLYGWKDGSLGNIHTPMGDAPVGVDTANNAREWDDMGGGYHWRMSYVGQHLLDTTVDKANSTWLHRYRNGGRLTNLPTLASTDAPAVTLADNSVTRPRVTLRPAWAQLLDSAAAGKGTSTTPLAVPADARATVTDPIGSVTSYSLSKFGSPTKVTAPNVPADSNEYDPLTGQLKRNISPTGAVTRLTWVNDQLRQTIDSGAHRTVNIDYTASYSLPKHIYGDVQEQIFTYDSTKAGWPLLTSKVGSSSATPTTYQFDSYGRPTSIGDPNGHTTLYGYQTTGLRNATSVTAPNVQTTSVGRDAWGRVVSVTDPYGRIAKDSLDLLNRTVWTANAANDTTRFQYDALNQVTVVTDPKGQPYTSTRNSLGWVTTQTDPGSRVDSMKYDIGGRVVYARTRAGRRISFVYDSLNRLTKKIGLTSADTIKYAYDPQSRWVVDSTVSGGTLVSVDSIVTDSVGRTIRERTIRPGVGSWEVSSGFNPTDPGRSSAALFKRSVSPPTTEAQITYTYDANKRLSTIQVPYGNSTFGYDAEDFPSTVTFQYGLVESTTQTSSHAESMRSYSVSTIDTVLKRWYKTDSLARLTERGGAGPLFQKFTYDSADRLRTWTKKARTNTPYCVNDGGYGYTCTGTIDSTISSVSMSYDRAGNPTDLSASVTAGNRLQTFNGFTMTYDADGNTLTRVGPGGVNDTYTWNDFGQLTSVTRSGVAQPTTFAYDGFGRRIRKTSAAGTIHYLWDRDQIFAEVDGSGTTLETYSYNPGVDQPRTVTAGGVVYLMSTGLGGDVNGLIRHSDNAVVAQYTYTPWGGLETDQQLIGGVRVNSLRWRGLVYDSETALYQMRARYYDPETRRFISEDPIGLEGGINQYAFADGDPVNRSDPSGLCWVWNANYRTTHPEEAVPTWHWSNDCPLAPAIPGVGGIYDSPWGDPIITRQLIDPRAVANTIQKIENAIKKAVGLEGSNTAAVAGTFITPPIAGPFGVAFPVAYVPSTKTVCGGFGLGISLNRSYSVGVVDVHAAPGNTVTDVLKDLSVSGGGNLTPVLGGQASLNSSGYTIGQSFGSPGVSGAVTFSVCHSFGGG